MGSSLFTKSLVGYHAASLVATPSKTMSHRQPFFTFLCVKILLNLKISSPLESISNIFRRIGISVRKYEGLSMTGLVSLTCTYRSICLRASKYNFTASFLITSKIVSVPNDTHSLSPMATFHCINSLITLIISTAFLHPCMSIPLNIFQSQHFSTLVRVDVRA